MDCNFIGFLGVIIAINPSGEIALASIYALVATLMWSITIDLFKIIRDY